MLRFAGLHVHSGAPIAALAASLLASVASAQSYKLNGPFATPVTGVLREVQTTPDGARAVYLADQETQGVRELFSVPIDGSLASVRVSVPLAAGGNVKFFALAPDGARVVFTADHATDGVFELFSAPVDGSAPAVRLNGPLVPGGSVGRDSDLAPPFQISVDGARVVYRADEQTDEVHELFSVPLGGGVPVRLNDPLGGPSVVASTFRIGADGLRVVYRVGASQLFSVPVDRSAPPVSLTGPMPAGRNTEQFEITPDASRVVYRADQEVDNRYELFSVPISGGTPPTKIATPTIPSGFETFLISPDSARVVYPEIEGPPWTRHLESVPVDGSATPVRLSGLFAFFYRIEFSPDSARVVYMAARDFDISIPELFSVPVDRRTSGLKLSPPLGSHASVKDFRISPDSRTVVYHTERYSDSLADLYSVPIDGGVLPRVRRLGESRPVVHLNDPFVPSGSPELWDYEISSDSTTVFYLAREVPDEWQSVYSVPIAGGASSVRLSGATPEESVRSFQLASDGRVLMLDLQDNTFNSGLPNALKAAPPDGSQPPVRITPVLATGNLVGQVSEFQTSAEDAWTVYLANQEQYYATEIFGVPTDGSLAPVKLNLAIPRQDLPGGISDTVISPDGARVAFVTEFAATRGEELSSAPVDGSAPAVVLHGPVPAGAMVESFRFDPDSQHVFFVLDQVVDNVHELYRVPADAGGPPIRLNPPLVAGGDVWSTFQIAPDGARVVYVADQTTNDVFELFAVPSDASAAPMRLSGPLVAGGDVGSSGVAHAISPDGAWVVYGADQRTDEVVELFAVPLDGSAAPVALNGPLVANGDVRAFRIDPTSARVVYQADEDADEVLELFSVPIDGSSAPVKLNGPLVGGGDVFLPTTFVAPPGSLVAFLIAPDGQRVVYVADQATDEQFELFSAPIDGSQAAVRLNGELVPGGDVAVFPQGPSYPPIFRPPQISPDGARVVYVANEELDDVAELFSVPIDGAQPSVRLSAPGSVASIAFAIHPDGTRVVYETSAEALLVAPIDGSQAPTALAGPLTVDLGFGPAFRITPDGSRVLYRAEQDAPGVTELYAVPLP